MGGGENGRVGMESLSARVGKWNGREDSQLQLQRETAMTA